MHDSRIFALESATGGVSVFQDGIFVTQDDLLLPEGARQHVVGRINLKGRDKCELSMDRNRIFWTSERKKWIRLALVDIANRLMNALDAQEAPMNTRNSFINQLVMLFPQTLTPARHGSYNGDTHPFCSGSHTGFSTHVREPTECLA